MKFEDFILSESINDKGILKAIFLAGTPGAGKSFVRKKLSGGVEPRVVNTDTWVEFLGAGSKGQWDFFKDDIKRISANQLSNYINSMLPLWIDGTSSKTSDVRSRQGIVESYGYDTGMLWVNTDLDIAIARAEEREKRIGRHVPTDFIVETWNKINRLKPYYKSEFDWFLEVDNNDGELTDKVLSKLYAKTNTFFSAPIKNLYGQDIIQELINNNGKYLSDTKDISTENIKQKVKGWYSY
jgi:shikimate kinase